MGEFETSAVIGRRRISGSGREELLSSGNEIREARRELSVVFDESPDAESEEEKRFGTRQVVGVSVAEVAVDVSCEERVVLAVAGERVVVVSVVVVSAGAGAGAYRIRVVRVRAAIERRGASLGRRKIVVATDFVGSSVADHEVFPGVAGAVRRLLFIIHVVSKTGTRLFLNLELELA